MAEPETVRRDGPTPPADHDPGGRSGKSGRRRGIGALLVLAFGILLLGGLLARPHSERPLGEAPSPLPQAPSPFPEPRPMATSIVDYLHEPGDRVIVVPKGTYSGGTVTGSRPASGGELGGWLVLVAEEPGQVVVDLAETGLNLRDGTESGDLRVMFVGITFKNGLVALHGVSHVRFWYCDFTFPAREWDRQWQAAGRPRKGDGMPNHTPSAIRIRSGPETGRQAADIGVYGSDFHDLGDDGIFFYSTVRLTIAGTRIWNVDEQTYDPEDWWHNDGIQTSGGAYGTTITHTYTPRVQWGAQGGTIDDGTFTDLWLAGSRSAAWINDVAPGQTMTTQSQDRIRAFGMPGVARWDVVDGLTKAWPDTHDDPRLDMTTENLVVDPPPGVDLDESGRLRDERQAVDHPQNPALSWREAHPYDGWASHLGVTR